MKLYDSIQMDSERFLKLKNWQDCFNSLSDLELKIATIFTIANAKTIHIAKSHQPTRKPKLGKEYGFPNADGQTGRKKYVC